MRNSIEEFINKIVIKLQSYENSTNGTMFAEKVNNLQLEKIKEWLYGPGKSASFIDINRKQAELIESNNDLVEYLRTLHQPVEKGIEASSSTETDPISESKEEGINLRKNVGDRQCQNPSQKKTTFMQRVSRV